MNTVSKVELTATEIMAQNVTELSACVDAMNSINWLVSDSGNDEMSIPFFKNYVRGVELSAMITAGCDLEDGSDVEEQVYAFGNCLMQFVSPQDARMMVECIAMVGQPSATFACEAIATMFSDPMLVEIRDEFCRVTSVDVALMETIISTKMDDAFEGVVGSMKAIAEWYTDLISTKHEIVKIDVL